jgi:hypothetical protein
MTLAVAVVAHSSGAPTRSHRSSFTIISDSHVAVVFKLHFPDVLGHVRHALPLIALCSLFWTAWDPTYYSFQKARIQGRDLRVRGKKHYIVSPYGNHGLIC